MPLDELGLLIVGAAWRKTPRRVGPLWESTPAGAAARTMAWPVLAPLVDTARRALATAPGWQCLPTFEDRFLRAGTNGLLHVGVLHALDRREGDRAVDLWCLRVELWRRGLGDAFPSPMPSRMDGTWTDERLAALDPATLARFDERLAALDAAWPRRSAPERLLADSARVHLATGSSGGPAHPTLRNRLFAWRYGFDLNRMEFAALDAYAAAVACLAPATRSWPERERQWATLSAADAPPWSTAMGLLDNLRDNERDAATWLAELRLLRLAVRWHLGAPWLALDDPFAPRPLSIEEFADHVRLRSLATHVRLERRAMR